MNNCKHCGKSLVAQGWSVPGSGVWFCSEVCSAYDTLETESARLDFLIEYLGEDYTRSIADFGQYEGDDLEEALQVTREAIDAKIKSKQESKL